MPDSEPSTLPTLIATLDTNYANALGWAERMERDYGPVPPHQTALARCRAAYIAMVSARVTQGYCIGWSCTTQQAYPGLCLTCALSDED